MVSLWQTEVFLSMYVFMRKEGFPHVIVTRNLENKPLPGDLPPEAHMLQLLENNVHISTVTT